MTGQRPDHGPAIDGQAIRNAVGQALDAVLLVRAVDAKTVVVEAANEAARALLDVETGQNLADSGTAPLAALTPRLLLAAERARATREPFVVRAESGAEVPVEVQLETMPGADGVTRVMAVFRTAEIDLGTEERRNDPTVGVFRIERGIGFVFVDDALCNLLGLSHEQTLGQGWLDAIVADDRARVEHALGRVDGLTEAIDLECRVLRHGVDERNIRIRAVPVRGDDGALTGYLGSIEDETEQQRSLRANTRLAELVDAVQEMVGVTDADWRLVYANPSCRELLCIGDEAPLSSVYVIDFIPDELRAEMTERIGRDLDRDGRWSGSLVLRALDGRLLDVQCTLLRHGALDDPDHYVSFLGRDVTALHQAEAALRDNEERFRLMAESSSVGIFMIGRGGVIEYANPRISEMLARPLSEVLGSIVTNAVHPDDKKRVYAESNAAARERRESALEFDALRPDGEVRRLRANSAPVLDDSGVVRGFVGSVLDITDERRAESRLSAGAAWFRSLVQHAPDLLAVLDADGTVRYVSPSAARLTGYEPEELVGARLSTLTEFDISGVAQQIATHPGTPVNVVAPLRHRDGSERVFEADITNLLDDQYVHGFVVNARDVTDRAEAEAGRRRSETALRAIVQASPLAIFALDRGGKVHLWNAASERMFGWSAAEVVGRPPPFFDDHAEFGQLLRRAFSGETVTGYEGRVARVDEETVDIDIAIAPLRDATGRVVTAVAVVADVTEQHRAEQELRENEVRFRSLVQHSTDMLTVVGGDGRIIYMSPSGAAFLGIDAAAAVGEFPPQQAVHPDDAEKVRAAFTSLRARPGSTDVVIYRIEQPGSGFRWVEMFATNLLDEPAVRGVVTNSRDITERVEAESTIRSSEERLRALVASVSDMIAVVDGRGQLQYASPVATQMLGYPEGTGYGQNIFELTHPDDREKALEMFAWAREVDGVLRPVEVRLARSDGEYLYAEIIANNLLDDPSVNGIVFTIRDITERRATEEALRASEQRVREEEARYRAVVDDQTELVCRYLPDTTLTFVNRAFAEFYGRSREELIGSRLIDLFPTGERNPELDRLHHFSPGADVQTQEDWELAADGSVYWYQWTDRAFLGDDGNVYEFQSVGRDITERRRATMLTAHQAEILEKVARGLPLEESLSTIARTVEDHFPKLSCAVSLLDDDGMTLRIGAAPTLPIGMRRALEGLRIGPVSCSGGTSAYRRERVHVEDISTDPLWVDHRDVAIAHNFHAAWSHPILASDGHAVLGTLDVYARSPQLPDAEHEQIISLLAHVASIGIERKAFEERLAHQSMHDPLTGLPNRLLFLDRLTLTVARCRRTHTQVAVLFLDLDRFKNVNDSVGHDAGDELLIAVSRRLESVLRPGDTVARFGGDEFTIVCEDLPSSSARERAVEIAARLLVAVAQPFIVRGTETFVSASLGIALANGDERPEELLRDADAAMYHAKEAGRGRVEVFDDTMRARAMTRHSTENALHRALERGELLLFFQPLVSLRDARCVGAEALVRWQHPERGLLPPSEFVPLAEETGLVIELGAWVLEEAAQQAARWQLDHDGPFVVSINLSARQLAQPTLVEQLSAVIERTGVLPSNLCLEITESVLMDDAEGVISVIERVRALGVQLAIDDFGTGYSSLGYLKRFPVDCVKIDRSFVDGLGTDPGDAAIVSAVIGLAHALNLQVVAEGVETEEQLAELVALGCDDAQGYFFAPPQPVDDLRGLIGRNRAWRPPGVRIMGGDARPGLRRLRS